MYIFYKVLFGYSMENGLEEATVVTEKIFLYAISIIQIRKDGDVD